MHREHLRRMLGRLKRALGIERPPTPDESNQLRQLADAIVEYGRMTQDYFGQPMSTVMVEITELARRFRESPQTIEDALLLLSEDGRASADHHPGCWKVGPACTSISSNNLDDEESDRGAA